MIVQFLPIITLAVLFSYLIISLFYTKDKNKLYVLFVLIAYPLMGLNILTKNIPVNNFEAITLLFMVSFYKHKPTFIHQIQVNPYPLLFGLLLATGLISTLLASSITADTAKAFIELIALGIFVFVLVNECIIDPAFVKKVVQGIQISVIVSLFFLLMQFIIGLDFTISKSLNGNIFQDDSIRYPSYFQDPQKYAQFLSIGSFIILYPHSRSFDRSVYQYALAGAMLMAILLTGGRAALGGWMVGFLFVLLCSKIDFKIIAGILILIGSAVVYQYRNQFIVFNRGDNLTESYLFRMGIWKEAYQIFQSNPLVGIAPGNYAHYVSINYPDQFWMLDNEIVYYDHPESGYLKILTEYGAVGFVALFLIILIAMIRGMIRFFRTEDIKSVYLIAAMICWLIGFYTIYSLGDVRIQIMVGSVAGLLMANETMNSYNHTQKLTHVRLS